MSNIITFEGFDNSEIRVTPDGHYSREKQDRLEAKLIEEMKTLTFNHHKLRFGEQSNIKINNKKFLVTWEGEWRECHCVSIYELREDSRFPSLIVSRSLLPEGREIDALNRSAGYLINELFNLYENLYGVWEKDIPLPFHEGIYKISCLYSIHYIIEFINFQLQKANNLRIDAEREPIIKKLTNRLEMLEKYNK